MAAYNFFFFFGFGSGNSTKDSPIAFTSSIGESVHTILTICQVFGLGHCQAITVTGVVVFHKSGFSA